MPSFISSPLFLFRYACLPLCILTVAYFSYALLRRRFEHQLELLSTQVGANLFVALPDALRTLTTLVAVPFWVFVFIAHSVRVVPATMAPLGPAFEKILDETLHTSAIDRFYVPSQGNRVTWEAETDLPLSVTYFMLGITRYRIELEDQTVLRALLPSHLTTEQAQEQIESEPLLLTPVSKNYFTPQALELAQSSAANLTPAVMVGETIRHTAPFHSAVAATRNLGWLMLPLLLLGSFLRVLQIRGLRQALQAKQLSGRRAQLKAPLQPLLTGTLTAFLGVALSRVETDSGKNTFLVATPYRLASTAPIEGRLIALVRLPLFSRPWQTGFFAACLLKPIALIAAPVAFASLYQQVFIPDALIERIAAQKKHAA
jgi:hypothetical protein